MIYINPLILGIVDKLNDWNDKLNAFFAGFGDNVFIGTLIFGGILVVAFWGINMFNRKP